MTPTSVSSADITVAARESDEKIKYMGLSANTLAFISCRHTLTKELAGAAREEKGSKGLRGRVRLLDVDTGRLLNPDNINIQ